MANCCMICYRVGPPNLVVENVSTEGIALKRFFQLLERHLADNDRSKEVKPQFPLEQVIKVGMSCCRECLHVTESFCDLYHQLKKIELLLNWKLWTLKNVMECAQKVPQRMKYFRESILNGDEGGGANPNPNGSPSPDELIALIVGSKKALIDHFSRKIKNTSPALHIVKWKYPGGTDLLQDVMTRPTNPHIEAHNHNGENDRQNWDNRDSVEQAGILTDAVDRSNTFASNVGDTNGTVERPGITLENEAMPRDQVHLDLDNSTENGNQQIASISKKLISHLTLQEETPSSFVYHIVKREVLTSDKSPGVEVSTSQCIADGSEEFDSGEETDSIHGSTNSTNDKTQGVACKDEPEDFSGSDHNILAEEIMIMRRVDSAGKEPGEVLNVVATELPDDTNDSTDILNHQCRAYMARFTSEQELQNHLENCCVDEIETREGITVNNNDSDNNPDAEQPQPGTSEKEHQDESGISLGRRFLRTVHRCSNCMKTFSSNERLTSHQVECCVDDAETDEEVEDPAENEIDFHHTDTTDTSDDDDDFLGMDDSGSGESEGEMELDLDVKHMDPMKEIPEPMLKMLPTNSKDDVEKPCKCPFCKQSYKDKRNLSHHVLLNHPLDWKSYKNIAMSKKGTDDRKPPSTMGQDTEVWYRYKCSDCRFMFSDMNSLLQHRHLEHPRPASLSPDEKRTTIVKLFCFTRCPTSYIFKTSKHSETFATLKIPDEGVFLCPKKKCRLPHYSKASLRSHRRLHGKFKCQFCDHVVVYAPDLADHELSHVKDVKAEQGNASGTHPWRCCRCLKVFVSEAAYESHHLRAHMSVTLDTNYCVICDTDKPYNRFSMVCHYKLCHDLNENNEMDSDSVKKCTEEKCSAYFLTIRKLKAHLRLCHGADNKKINEITVKHRSIFQCKDCDNSFTTRSYLTAHRVRFHVDANSLINCEVDKCELTFETKEELERHVQYRHAPKNMEFIECPKCNKSYNGLSTLKMHMKSHDEGKARRFPRRTRSRKPILTKQSGALHFRFKCPVCSKLYRHLYDLLVHRKESHQAIPSNSNPTTIENCDKITVEIFSFSQSRIPPTLERANNFNSFATFTVKDNVFVCPVNTCQRSFYFAEDLEAHAKLHGEFKCNFCDVAKEYAPDLSEHELIHHDDEEKQMETEQARNSIFTCPHCKLAFQTKETYLRHHLQSHLMLSPVEHKCGICGKPGGSGGFFKHYKRSHDVSSIKEGSANICKIGNCAAYFVTGKQLTFHQKLEHKNAEMGHRTSQKVKCQDCGKLFKNCGTLRTHRLKLHLSTMQLINCSVPQCAARFEKQDELDRHTRWQHAPGKIDVSECPKCKRVFTGTTAHASFKKHMKAHERKEQIATGLIPSSSLRHVCEICGKSFKEKLTLQMHSLSHSGPESWEFTCGVCSKKCLTKQKLEEHLRTHSQEKPFVCEVCGTKYAHRHNLRIHVNSKHGDVMQDIPRKFNAPNLTSRKGIKRKRKQVAKETSDVEYVDSDSD